MHRILAAALPLLAGVATAAPARQQQEAADRRDLICLQVEPSTVFLPTIIYVTKTAWSIQSAEPPARQPLSQSASTTAAALEPTATELQPVSKLAPFAERGRAVPKPKTGLVDGLKWGNFTQRKNTMANYSQPVGATKAGNLTAGSSRKQAPFRPNKSMPARNVLYYTNWGIYDANCQPQDVPADQVTHLLYAFGDLEPDGTVISSDTYADIEKRFSGDELVGRGNNVYGVVNQLFIMKKKNRRLKTLFSIGGSKSSQQGKFSRFAVSAEGRNKFATSAVRYMADWGMDGLDIDWEYPQDELEASSFVELVRETRRALDEYAAGNGQQYHYLLTVAAPAAPQHYGILHLEAMDRYVDGWNLMSYDYAGGWDKTTGHHSNIRPDTSAMASTRFDTDQAVADYARAGIAAHKILLGLPLYGRSFGNTDGLGRPFEGAGQNATQEGVIPYRHLPRPGAVVELDEQLGAAWSFDPASRQLVSYDNVASAKLKARYVKSKRLGGVVFWEASGDKQGDKSLVRTVASSLGALDDSENMLHYPRSQYDNIRNGVVS